MRRFLTHLHRHSHILRPCQPPSRVPTTKTNLPFLRLLSDDASPPPDAAPSPSPPPPTDDTEPTPTFADVPTKEYLRRINAGLVEGDDSELPSVIEAIFQREHAGGHSDTDEEIDSKLDVLLERLVDEYEVSDQELLENFEESHETNQELNDLYNARQYVEQKFRQNKALNMDDIKWDAITKGPSPKERLRMMKEYSKEELRGVAKKHWKEVKDCAKKNKLEVDVNLDLDLDDATWDDMIKEEQTKLSNMKECEDTLEGMLQWDKIIPDELKEKSEAKFNELEDMCERGELEPEQAYELFKEFEDKMVAEYTAVMEAESPTADELSEPDNKSVKLNDPPGAGPVLRWESTIVFAPTGVAWHPKNRKVKLSVTVKELGLSRHAFRRLREVVGKRYNSGKDELTITSERFDHREENRKDCLRTLYALVEDAMKADVLADDARNAYVKGRLKANSQFMDRLKTKTQKLRVAA